jgi:hypothetical protein
MKIKQEEVKVGREGSGKKNKGGKEIWKVLNSLCYPGIMVHIYQAT